MAIAKTQILILSQRNGKGGKRAQSHKDLKDSLALGCSGDTYGRWDGGSWKAGTPAWGGAWSLAPGGQLWPLWSRIEAVVRGPIGVRAGLGRRAGELSSGSAHLGSSLAPLSFSLPPLSGVLGHIAAGSLQPARRIPPIPWLFFAQNKSDE